MTRVTLRSPLCPNQPLGQRAIRKIGVISPPVSRRLYDVERWIQARRPLKVILGGAAGQRRVASALEIALEAGNQALVFLLLCNGYDSNLELDS